jgi:hypothetical protein
LSVKKAHASTAFMSDYINILGLWLSAGPDPSVKHPAAEGEMFPEEFD